jgi:hypothetical protein
MGAMTMEFLLDSLLILAASCWGCFYVFISVTAWRHLRNYKTGIFLHIVLSVTSTNLYTAWLNTISAGALVFFGLKDKENEKMNLQQFLNENTVDNVTAEVIISPRFKDENGEPLKFKIRAITGEDHKNYVNECMKLNAKTKQMYFDNKKFYELVIINATIEPNFKDATSIKQLNCVTPERYLYKVLLAGEIETLAQEISALSGFDVGMDELRAEAKN